MLCYVTFCCVVPEVWQVWPHESCGHDAECDAHKEHHVHRRVVLRQGVPVETPADPIL